MPMHCAPLAAARTSTARSRANSLTISQSYIHLLPDAGSLGELLLVRGYKHLSSGVACKRHVLCAVCARMAPRLPRILGRGDCLWMVELGGALAILSIVCTAM
jgi:hypothetical protein